MKFSGSLVLGLIIAISITSCDFIKGLLPTASESNLEGYAYASKDRDDWGLLDSYGRVIVEDEWKTPPSAPKEGMVFVVNKKGEIEFFTVEEKPKQIGDEYKAVLPFCEGLAAVVEPNKTICFINKTGEIEFELTKEIVEVRSFSEGFAPYKNKDNEWGFINRLGKEEIDAKWNRVGNFSEGLALVTTYDKDENVYKYAFIDNTGKTVLDLDDEYDRVGSFADGRCQVLDDDEWGFIDRKGEEIIKCKWESATAFRDGHAAIQDDGEWGLIDDSGEITLRAKYGPGLAQCFYYPRTKDIFFEVDGDEIEAYNFEGDKLFSIDGTEAVPFCGDFTAIKDKDEYYFIKDNGEPVNDEDFDVVNLDGLSIIMPYYLNSTSVKSDFFDVGAVISGLKVKPALPLSCNLKQLMESHGVANEDLPKEKWGSSTSFRKSLELGDGQVAKVKYVFHTNVTSPEKKNITTTNYWGKAVTKRDFTGEFLTENDAKLKYIEWEIRPTGKGNGKEKMIAEALIEELKGAYPSVKIEAAEDNTNSSGSFFSVDNDGNSGNESLINVRLEYSLGHKVEFLVWLPEDVE